MSAKTQAHVVVRLVVALVAIGLAWVCFSGAVRAQPTDDSAKSAETETKEKADETKTGTQPTTSGETTVTPAEGVPPAADANTPRSSGLYGPITNTALRRFLVLITAFLIGVLGAAAFHLGVYTGFIARESRANLLEYLHAGPTTGLTIQIPWFIRGFFWLSGGVVAMVFQMADADSLVPIQAFVLGASWPSVVTQLMSGRSGPAPPPTTASPPPPPPVQPPAGGAAVAPAPPPGGAPPIQVAP